MDTSPITDIEALKIAVPIGTTWERYTGGCYIITGYCTLTAWYELAVLYKPLDDSEGTLATVVPAFLDGRFERV